MVGETAPPMWPIAQEPDIIAPWWDGDPIDFEIPNPLVYELEKSDQALNLKTLYDAEGVPLMRKDLAAVLQKLGVEGLELFPARLIDPATGRHFDNYLAFNLVGLVSAVGDATCLAGTTPLQNMDTDIDSLVIDAEKAGGRLLFRLQENIAAIIAHESVKQAVESEGIEGVMFYDPKHWAG